MGTEPRPSHLGVARGSPRCPAPSSRFPMLLCLYPPGSMRCPASVLPCPPAVPSTSFRVLTLSRPCPSLSTLRPALVLSALTAGAATSLGSRLGARPTAPAARRGGALGVIGSAPDPAAARASPHHPRPAAIRPCSRPLSGPAAPPHPPPRFLFPAGSPGLSWRGPQGPPTPARPPTGRGRHTHDHTPAHHRRTPCPGHAHNSCPHPPHAERQGAAGYPEPWTGQVSAALSTLALRPTGHINSASSGFRSHTQDPRTPTSTCMVYPLFLEPHSWA